VLIDQTLAHENPFAVLTAIVAPAILTNACSVLSLGTSNRLARVVDRTRVVAAEIKSREPGSFDYMAWADQLGGLHLRAQLLIGALRAFYAALGAFAAAALVSVLGGVAAYYGQAALFRAAAIAAIATGTFAVIALVRGTIVVMRETRIAIRNLAEEAKLRSPYQQTMPPPTLP
jgi:Protein of unknown function (DUF2721)